MASLYAMSPRIALLTCCLFLPFGPGGVSPQSTYSTLYEGSACKLAGGKRGQCIAMTKCPSALAEFKRDRRNFRPKRCGFQGFVEVICCADVPLRKAEEACRDFTNEINPSINFYIYGGSVAEPGEFPHMVGTDADDLAEGFQEGGDAPLWRAPSALGRPLTRLPPSTGAPPGAPPGASDKLIQDADRSGAGGPSNPPTTVAPEGPSTAASLDRSVRNPELDDDGDPSRATGADDSSDAEDGSSLDGPELGSRMGLLAHVGQFILSKVETHRKKLHRWHQDRVHGLMNHFHLEDTAPPTQPPYPPPRPPPKPADRTPSAPSTTPEYDYSRLIDPRIGDGQSRPTRGEPKESFSSFDEDTTSRPRLVPIANASWAGQGKGATSGTWRVPPGSIWKLPPGSSSTALPPAAAALPGGPPPPPFGAAVASSEGKAGGPPAGVALYVIGGLETMPEEFKHMVALGYKPKGDTQVKWDCGGSLISKRHVLTAAHCVTNPFRGKPVRVRVGAHNLTDTSPETAGQEYAVEDVVWHPQYSTKSHYNDVAVVKIQQVEFNDRVQPACLYSRNRAPDSGMIATGWGVTDIDQLDQTSDVLMKAGMDQVPLSRCNTSFTRSQSTRLARGIQPEQLCARGSDGIADTCLGDSGGPLQALEPPAVLYSIVGITSFGQLCGGLGVYTRVSSYLDWIESVVWPDS